MALLASPTRFTTNTPAAKRRPHGVLRHRPQAAVAQAAQTTTINTTAQRPRLREALVSARVEAPHRLQWSARPQQRYGCRQAGERARCEEHGKQPDTKGRSHRAGSAASPVMPSARSSGPTVSPCAMIESTTTSKVMG